MEVALRRCVTVIRAPGHPDTLCAHWFHWCGVTFQLSQAAQMHGTVTVCPMSVLHTFNNLEYIFLFTAQKPVTAT